MTGIEMELMKELQGLSEQDKKEILEFAKFKKQKKVNKQNKTLGLFADIPDEMDKIVEDAMKARETMEWRSNSNG